MADIDNSQETKINIIVASGEVFVMPAYAGILWIPAFAGMTTKASSTGPNY